MRRTIAAAVLFGTAIWMKFFLPGFGEEFVPLLRSWLTIEQVQISLPAEAMAWLRWN